MAETMGWIREATCAGVAPEDAALAMRRSRQGVNAAAVAMFMGTIDGLTLNEAMANAELDARAYGWSRATTRTLASRIRLHFAGRR